MYDWIGANWIWILLGVGLLWFMFRPGGMGCGMGGHGRHDHAEGSHKELPPGDTVPGAKQAERPEEPVTASRQAHRHGGCC